MRKVDHISKKFKPSGYIGTIEKWNYFWGEIDRFFSLEKALKNSLIFNNCLVDENQHSLNHFLNSGGVEKTNKIFKQIKSWPLDVDFFLEPEDFFVLGKAPEKINETYYIDFSNSDDGLFLKGSPDIDIDIFFDYENGCYFSEYLVPEDYFASLKDGLVFSENILTNEIYWISNRYTSSEGEWEYACYQPGGLLLVRLNCFARAFYHMLENFLLYQEDFEAGSVYLKELFCRLMFNYQIKSF